MRMSRLFCQTLRENPSEAEIASHQLLIRAGFVRTLAAGSYSFLPLGYRVKRKIEDIFRQEMDAIGGQQMDMPVVHPAELWQETQRWYQVGPEMVRLTDRADRDLVLGMTHEEVITDIVRRQVKSYRQLPVLMYQIQTKYRDEPRPRGGLIRTREFTMKDLYSFHPDAAGLDGFYPEVYQAYFNIFHRCGLDVLAVLSDTGMMGGTMAHEFMFVTDAGEDTLILCPSCNYAANRQIARFDKPPAEDEAPLPLEEIATPDATTIDQLTAMLGVPRARTLKATFFMADDRFVMAMIRGDMEVNETKLVNLLGAKTMRPATVEESRATGAEPGYGSPIGLKDVRVVVDDMVPRSPNLVSGANREGHHVRNVNFGRDFTTPDVADIAAAQEGDRCAACGGALTVARGVEAGNIFKLGTKYSESMGATFLDSDGESHPLVMGSYGIGTGRLMACVVEKYHDEKGMMWPVTIAPYEVYLLSLGSDPQVAETADRLYQALQDAGIETLYDDRPEPAGVKFNDADLLGMPLRITVSTRNLKRGEVEWRLRHDGQTGMAPIDDAVADVRRHLDALREAVRQHVRPMPFVG